MIMPRETEKMLCITRVDSVLVDSEEWEDVWSGAQQVVWYFPHRPKRWTRVCLSYGGDIRQGRTAASLRAREEFAK